MLECRSGRTDRGHDPHANSCGRSVGTDELDVSPDRLRSTSIRPDPVAAAYLDVEEPTNEIPDHSRAHIRERDGTKGMGQIETVREGRRSGPTWR